MSRIFRSYNKTARCFITALCLMTGLFTYGALAMPPVTAMTVIAAATTATAPGVMPAAASSILPAVSSTVVNNYLAACAGTGTSTEAVPICQQPLTIQPPVPPDIVLMLDDSGSMAWDYMPDACYLYGVACSSGYGSCQNGTSPINNVGNGTGQCTDYITSVNNDAVIDSSNNGVYYNPAVVYTPPPQVNGTAYPSYTDFTNVPLDGFNTSNGYQNVTQYSNNDLTGEQDSDNDTISYSTSNQQQVTTNGTYNQTVSYTGNGWWNYTYADQVCKNTVRNYTSYSNYKFTGLTQDSNGNWLTGTCYFNYTNTTNQTFYYFQYSTGPAAGPYTVHYVAPASQGCGTQTNCVVDSDTSGTAAPAKDASGNTLTAGENIANWFAYYHTRIQMAKSGLMTAFSGVNPAYRVGFGSIDANGINNIPSPYYTFNDASGYGTGSSSNQLAEVQPFGNGTSGTQKANFWTWIAGESAGGGTPLRLALNAVGQYYSDSGQQAWSTMNTDPGWSSTTPPASGSTNNTKIACRQAYTILTTDGFWNENSNPQVNGNNIGDVDGTPGNKITGPDSQSYTYSPIQPFTDNLISSSTSYYSATCTQHSGDTLNTSTGVCSWTEYSYDYTSGRHTRRGYAYGACPSNAIAGTCAVYKTGSYSVCNSGDTWNQGKQECAHTTVSGTSYANTLADVAMYYWGHDLQTGISNEVPTDNNVDPAFWQHMVTFTMGLGFTPTGITGTAPNGDNPPTTADIFKWSQDGGGPDSQYAIKNFSWPQPSSNSLYNIADLEHAGVNGHGGFFSATSPQTFVSGLQEALKRAAEREGSGASLAANSTQLKTGTVAFQATYHTAIWTGDLEAYGVNQSDGTIGSMKWSASAQLLASGTTVKGKTTYANRDIMTYNPGASGSAQFVAFANTSAGAPPALSTAELAALGGSAAAQANMVNYLRGDNTLEETNGGDFRNRSTPLGDIVDSQPVYAGAPDPNAFVGQTFTGSSSYGTFATTEASREALVFVAANDGMLHAFDATTGDEKFAYLPGAVITAGVANLANPAYGSEADPHQDYNDGQLTIADAYFDEGSGAAWHTVLVGTTGRGSAKAVYALDITDPTDIKFLWERSAGDGLTNSNYIGQMVGKPVIALTATSANATTAPTWSVLIGNGYNSAKGQAALLQFDLATGKLYVHTTSSNASANGLAAPVTWIGTASNGLSTDAYAGDLLGHVWDFPLNTTTCTGTPPNQTCTQSATPSSNGTLLFTAQDGSGKAQPITAGMLAGMDPASGNVWVFFGTGKYLQYGDLQNTQVQGWYGLIVQQGANQPALPSLPTTTGGGHMVQRYITAQTAASGSTLAARTITQMPSPSDMSGKLGWYMNLEAPNGSGGYTAQGEMMVDPNQFQSNLLLGTTRVPVVTDICNPSGSGWVMALNPFTGTNPGNNFFDVNGDGAINSGDEINGAPAAGVGFSSMPNAPIFVGGDMLTSFENGTMGSLGTAGATGNFQRVSWREIIDQ